MTDARTSPHLAPPSRPLFRCKVLKPPRTVVEVESRVVTHPPLDVVAGVIRREDGQLLITQRRAGDTLGGYWEFPGGKVEPGEDFVTALRRELREEIGVECQIGPEIHRFVHPYPDRDVRLYFFAAQIITGEPQALDVADLRWVKVSELFDYQFPEADRFLLEQLRKSAPAD